MVAVYAPNIDAEKVSFFRRLAPFLDDPKWIVLVDDWNAILDPKTDRVRRGDRGSRWHESSLIDVMARHDLVNRFRLDQTGRKMWTCLDSWPTERVAPFQLELQSDMPDCPRCNSGLE